METSQKDPVSFHSLFLIRETWMFWVDQCRGVLRMSRLSSWLKVMSLGKEWVTERSKEARLWSLVPEQKTLAKIWVYIYKAWEKCIGKEF